MSFRGDSKVTTGFVPLLTLTDGQMSDGMIGVAVERGRNIVNDGEDVCVSSSGICANGGTCQNTGQISFKSSF